MNSSSAVFTTKMVSLANGCADVLSNAMNDSAEEENKENGPHKEQNNARLEQEPTQRVWVDLFASKCIADPSSLEVTHESSANDDAVTENKLVETIVAVLDKTETASKPTDKGLCNGTNDSLSAPSSVINESSIDGDKSSSASVAVNTTSVSTVSTPTQKYIFVGSLKNIGKGENQRQLYLVNKSSVLKGTSQSDLLTNHDSNTIVTPSINNVIGKMKIVPANSEAQQTFRSIPTTRSFVQLSQSNMKNITLNVTPSSKNSVILKPNQQPYEILRAKLMENRFENVEPLRVQLMENRSENAEPPLTEIATEPVRGKPAELKTVLNALKVNVPKSVSEPAAITEARNELDKCKKKLLQAALYPSVATKVPLNGYVGPIFSCEECEDTFVSEDSLMNHKDRRSVLFTYACPPCKQTLEFYNRCMFLLHLRSHDSTLKACFLTISIIPSNKLKFQVLVDDDESTEDQVLAQTRLTFAPSVQAPVTSKPTMPSAEKTAAESSSVRIVKSSKKKKSLPVATTADHVDDEPLADATPHLKSLLVGEPELSRTKSRDESSKPDNLLSATIILPTSNEKKSSEGNMDDETTSVKSPKTKKKTETVVKSKTVSKQSVPSATTARQEANDSNEATTSAAKKNDEQTKTSTTSPNIEEITLDGSDEEEDTLPDSNDKKALVSCRDCKKDVPYLTQHYRGENRPKKEYPCEQCQYFNASACALSAHVRMHTKTQPFVCPDCGYFFSTLETFLLHVKQVCFYDFKAIRFKCPECPALKPSAPKFADHLQRDHTREVFKCDACETSAYSLPVVEAHIAKMHPSPEKPISILEGYWCKLCPNMLVSKALLNQHINKHVYGLQYLRYVYICKMCKSFATLRRSKFADHYHTVCAQSSETPVIAEPRVRKPTRTRKRSGAKKLIASTTNKSVKANGKRVKKATKESSLENACATDGTKKDVEVTGNLCVMCRQTSVSESSSLFCHQCVRINDADDSSSATGTAGSEHASRYKRKFKCKLCKECMDRDWATITKHFDLYHRSDFDVSAKLRTASADPNQSAAGNRKRKLSVKNQESTKVPKVDTKYKCAKCSITMNDRKQFHEHIVSHKAQSDFQCLECGLCFIVRLSLEKHLILEHKIRHADLKEYFKANGMEVVEEKVEERVLQENQCEVCFLQCGSKQIYDKHIRTHGMAFVAMQSKAKI